jgi:hypothetical protein
VADDRRARLLDQLRHVQIFQVHPLPFRASSTRRPQKLLKTTFPWEEPF